MGAFWENIKAVGRWIKNDVIHPLIHGKKPVGETLKESIQVGMRRYCNWAEDEDTWFKFHGEIPCNFVPKTWEVARQLSKMGRTFTITTTAASIPLVSPGSKTLVKDGIFQCHAEQPCWPTEMKDNEFVIPETMKLEFTDFAELEHGIASHCHHQLGNDLFSSFSEFVKLTIQPDDAFVEFLTVTVASSLEVYLRDAEGVQDHREQARLQESYNSSKKHSFAVDQHADSALPLLPLLGTHTIDDECAMNMMAALDWLERTKYAHMAAWYNLLWGQYSYIHGETWSYYHASAAAVDDPLLSKIQDQKLLLSRGTALFNEYKKWKSQFDHFLSISIVKGNQAAQGAWTDKLQQSIQELKTKIQSTADDVDLLTVTEVEELVQETGKKRFKQIWQWCKGFSAKLWRGLMTLLKGQEAASAIITDDLFLHGQEIEDLEHIMKYIRSLFMRKQTIDAYNEAYVIMGNYGIASYFTNPTLPKYEVKYHFETDDELKCYHRAEDGVFDSNVDTPDGPISIPKCLTDANFTHTNGVILGRSPDSTDDDEQIGLAPTWRFPAIEENLDAMVKSVAKSDTGPGWIFTALLNQFDASNNWSMHGWFDAFMRESWLDPYIDVVNKRFIHGKRVYQTEQDAWLMGFQESSHINSRSEQFWKKQHRRFPLNATCQKQPDYTTMEYPMDSKLSASYLDGFQLGSSGIDSLAPHYHLRKLIYTLHSMTEDTFYNSKHKLDEFETVHATKKETHVKDHTIPQREMIVEALPFGAVFRAICQPVKLPGLSPEKTCNDPSFLRFGSLVEESPGVLEAQQFGHDFTFTPTSSFNTEDWRLDRHPVLSKVLPQGAEPIDAFRYMAHRMHSLVHDCLENEVQSVGLFTRKQFPYNISGNGGIVPDHAIPDKVTDDPSSRGIPSVRPMHQQRPQGLIDPQARPIDDCVPFYSLFLMEPAFYQGISDDETRFWAPDVSTEPGFKACEFANQQQDYYNQFCFPMQDGKSDRKFGTRAMDENNTFKCRENSSAEECYWCTAAFVDQQLQAFKSLCRTVELDLPGHGRITLEESGNLICEFVSLYTTRTTTTTVVSNNADEILEMESAEEESEERLYILEQKLNEMSLLELATHQSQIYYKDSQLPQETGKAKYWDKYFNMKYQFSNLVSWGIAKATNGVASMVEKIHQSSPFEREELLNYLVDAEDEHQLSYLDIVSFLLTSSEILRLSGSLLELKRQVQAAHQHRLSIEFWLLLISGWTILFAALCGDSIYRSMKGFLVGDDILSREEADVEAALKCLPPAPASPSFPPLMLRSALEPQLALYGTNSLITSPNRMIAPPV